MTSTVGTKNYHPLDHIGDMGFTVMVRRARFIDVLRSGAYVQGDGSLFYNHTYCCIGVGCSLLGISDSELSTESMFAYQMFMLEYRVDDKLRGYLIGMNDGTRAYNDDTNEFGDVVRGNDCIRWHTDTRSFKKIARFLEVIWFHEN